MPYSRQQPEANRKTGNLFRLRITKVKWVSKGCAADAESATHRFKISADVPAACAMLRAGKTYKAFRATLQNNPSDRSKDSAVLVIYNNVTNSRDNSVFDIDSEKAITKRAKAITKKLKL